MVKILFCFVVNRSVIGCYAEILIFGVHPMAEITLPLLYSLINNPDILCFSAISIDAFIAWRCVANVPFSSSSMAVRILFSVRVIF